MKIKEIYDFLNSISPFELAESWDNCGLILGNMDDEFDKVYMGLDIDSDILDACEPNSLIITHHPLIFAPLKKINFDTFSTKLLKIAIKKDLKLIAMHTNFDKTHLNIYVFEQILGFKIKSQKDFIASCEVDMSFDELFDLVKNKLNLNFEKFTKTHENIKKIALTTGSGGSLLSKIDADTFLTSDIKYHEAMEAKELNINLIEIGHFESEVHFGEVLSKEISVYLKKNDLKDIITASKNPFIYRRTN